MLFSETDVKKLKSRRKHTTPINTNNHDTGSNMVMATVSENRLSKDKKNELNVGNKHQRTLLKTKEEPISEENIYANSTVSVVKFEDYVARKKAKLDEYSDEFKVLFRIFGL